MNGFRQIGMRKTRLLTSFLVEVRELDRSLLNGKEVCKHLKIPFNTKDGKIAGLRCNTKHISGYIGALREFRYNNAMKG